MMIELNDRYRRLIHKLEKENCRNYRVYEIRDRYYIDIDDLLDCLDDTQDSREYAEEKFKDYVDDVETRKEENTPGLLNSYQKECERLKEENDDLRTTIQAIQSTLNEDDYDRLAEEGIEINE